MERIHESIKKIEIANAATSGEMKGFVQSMNEFAASIKKDVYEKGGLLDRTGSHAMQLFLQWGLLTIIIATIIGMALIGKR